MAQGSVIGLTAKLTADTDEQQVRRETKSLSDKISDAATADMGADTSRLKEDIKVAIEDAAEESKFMPDVDMDAERRSLPGFSDGPGEDLSQQMEALGKEMPDQIGGPAARGAEGPGAGGILSKLTGAGGSFLKVGLSSVVGLGILGAVTQFADAAPRMAKVMSQLWRAVNLFARPFFDLIARFLQGPINELLKMGANFNKLYQEKGLAVALAETGSDFVFGGENESIFEGLGRTGGMLGGAALGAKLGSPLGVPGMIAGGAAGGLVGMAAGTHIGQNVSDLLSGEINAENIVSGTVAATALIVGGVAISSFLTSVSVGGLLGGVSVGGLLSTVSVGGLLGGVAASTLIVGAVTAGSLIVGTVALGELIEIAQGGKGVESAYEAGQGFAEKFPNAGGAIEGAFTSDYNPAYFLGKSIGGGYDSPTGSRGDAAQQRDKDGGSDREGTDRKPPDNAGPGMAEGGIVTDKTRALIGEGNEPEAVLPLSKLGDVMRQENVRAGSSGGSARASDRSADEIVRLLEDLVDQIQRFDADVELRTDTKTLAEESKKGDHRFNSRKVISR